MKLVQEVNTVIYAEEGNVLVRKRDGWIVGPYYPLGRNYYEGGVPLAGVKLEMPDDFEEILIPEGYEIKPIINQSKRLECMVRLLEQEKREFKSRGLSATEMIAFKQFAPKWLEDDGFMVGDSVVKGDKFTYDGKLWSVLQDHTIMPHYYPSINTASLYVEVTEDYNEAGEELGTLENPIEYSGNMVLEEGKFYIQDEVTYRCTRNSINPVYHALKDLVGTFVETA